MSYGGHVLDMINRIKENKALKDARQDRYQRVKDIHAPEHHQQSAIKKEKASISIEKLETIKTAIRQRLSKQRRRETIGTMLVMAIFSAAMVMLFRYWIDN
jgi:predicted DNA binding CopG/RHH family protein